MFVTRRQWLAVSLLSVALTGCDPTQPTAPRIQDRSAAAPQTTVNAPSNLSATAASQSRINVAWQDNSSNETGFEIRRSTAGPSGSFILLQTMGLNATSYADTGLNVGTQYCYEIRAFSVSKKTTSYSTFAATACATTPPPPPPAAPTYFTAWPNGLSITLEWSDFSIVDTFRIERSLDAGGTWSLVGTLAAADAWAPGWQAFLFSDGSPATEQPLCYRVTAINAGGQSPPSDTSCTASPTAPTNLTATFVDDTTNDLSWSDNSSVEDGYNVWAATNCSNCYPADLLIAQLPPNTTTYRDTGISWLCGCQVVAYYVVAAKGNGGSEPSDYVYPSVAPSGSARLSNHRTHP